MPRADDCSGSFRVQRAEVRAPPRRTAASLTSAQRCFLRPAPSVPQVDVGSCSNSQALAGAVLHVFADDACLEHSAAVINSRCSVLCLKRFPLHALTSSTWHSPRPLHPRSCDFFKCLALSPSLELNRFSPITCSNSFWLPFLTKLLEFANSNPVQRDESMMYAAVQKGRLSSPLTRSYATRRTTTSCTNFMNIYIYIYIYIYISARSRRFPHYLAGTPTCGWPATSRRWYRPL